MSLRVMVNKKYLRGILDVTTRIKSTPLYQTIMCSSSKFSINASSFLSRWINHPSYSANTQDNDFAIIKLGSPVVFSEGVSPVCLPSASTNFDSNVATVTGWGTLSSGGSQPNILQKVQLTFTNYWTLNTQVGAPLGNSLVTFVTHKMSFIFFPFCCQPLLFLCKFYSLCFIISG